jgi:DNA adenine methylase
MPSDQSQLAKRSASIVFLNRTCFNGLFRVNRKGEFNVPHGRYRNPAILDEDNLRAFSRVLVSANILCEDFSCAKRFASPESFIYYDPPYRPLSQTSSFTSYSQHVFDDPEQVRLAHTFRDCHELGALQMLSNSDPFSASGDRFFEDLYDGFNIHRVMAKRAINSVSSGRGPIGEILVTNFDVGGT